MEKMEEKMGGKWEKNVEEMGKNHSMILLFFSAEKKKINKGINVAWRFFPVEKKGNFSPAAASWESWINNPPLHIRWK